VAAEQARPDIAAARESWNALKPTLDVRHLVFIGETWTKTNMTLIRGRAPRGKRLVGAIPHGHWKTSTFIAGLPHDRVVAPLMLDGAINGDVFRAYVEQFLAPTLVPGDIVIADNLSSHKVAGVREAIQAREASLWFLPGYSPDLNPIEQGFSKLKALIRKAAPRTREALLQRTGSIVQDFTPAECANFLANAGHRQSA
jgi:transposase